MRSNFYLSGVSLIEIIISIALLSLILLSIVTVLPSAIEGIKFSKNISIATNIATKHIQRYKSDFYQVPSPAILGGIELTANEHSSLDYPCNMEDTVFTPTCKVKQVNFEGVLLDPNEVVQISVNVYWKQTSGVKKVTIESYIYNKKYLPTNVPVY